jgi:hypothetical protein
VPGTDGVAQADVVIGIAGVDSPGPAGTTIEAVRAGISQHLDSSHARILVAESRSIEGPIEQGPGRSPGSVPLTAVAYDVDSRDLLRVPYHGLPGRVHALRALLETAREGGAKACAVLDAGLPGVMADRIRWLVRPILDAEMDFVTAYYSRHTVDGAITKSILYPMFRAVFGCQIRQPAAREFGCSDRALAHLLDQRVWEEDGRDEAIDIWMTAEAVCAGLRICEAQLAGKQHELDVADVSTMLAQVAGSLFAEVDRRAGLWHRIRSAAAVRRVGESSCAEGPEPTVDVQRLIESFRLGYEELKEVWSEILPPLTIIELKAMAHAPVERFRIDDRSWARIIYDFAVGHHLHIIRREHLLGSLTPLYLGWLASFVLETGHADGPAIEARLERVCDGFESEKPYLISRWRWPERFRS